MQFINLIFLLLFTKATLCSQIGSTLFYKKFKSDCWSQEDIAKLCARRAFERIIPPPVAPDKINDIYVKQTLRYYRNAFKAVDINSGRETSRKLKEVLADTVGAHLRSEVLPAARFAYYAGYVSYRNARELHDFFDEMKIFLNTQGLGWKSPSVPQMSNFTVDKILIGPDVFDQCARLVTKRDSRSCIYLPTPVSDDHLHPNAIALPFKSGGLVSLASPHSENVLLKYYTTATKCILRNSPTICRHSDFVNFNEDLWHWMKRDVAPRLVDEKLYTAYGGILRIAAAVQSYGKGLRRRNLFEFQDAGVSSWHPWKALKESYVYINTDWTPYLYVIVILLIGFAICLLQICYTYILGDEDTCPCKKSNPPSITKEVAYAKVDSNIPAMLPSHQTTTYYSDHRRETKSDSKTKSSLGSIKRQKVFDMHENTEKVMDVIMSEESSIDSEPSESQSKSENIIDVGHLKRSKSPPKIDTSIKPKKVDKKSCAKERVEVPMFSNSTVTNSEQTYQGAQATDSWSGTGSSTSCQSGSSRSCKSQCRRTRNSRDLAWARRVISKHTIAKSPT